MDTRWMAIMALAAVGAQAEQPARKTNHELTVYLEGPELVPGAILGLAKGITSEIYGRIGVRLRWVHAAPSQGQVQREQAIVIKFAADAPGLSPNALAKAFPYEGSAIVVVYSHLQWAEASPGLAPRLLGHVLAHEIAHNLEGISRHSPTGVLKANWTARDYSAMCRGPLAFEPDDLYFIRCGLERRAARRAELISAVASRQAR